MRGDEALYGLVSLLPLLVVIVVVVYLVRRNRAGSSKPGSGAPSAVLAVVVYWIVAGALIEVSFGALILFILYLTGAMVGSYALLKKDIAALEMGAHRFKRIMPFERFGRRVHEFQYSFRSESDDVVVEARDAILANLRSFSGFSNAQVVTVSDVDKKLSGYDSRDFLLCRSGKTLRGGCVTQLIRVDRHGAIQSIKWWFLVAGEIDRAAIVTFVALAPFTLPLWIVPRLSGTHNLAARLATVFPAFYESHDLVTIVNGANKLTIDTLIEVLDGHGIDTSDLKAQQAQTMNISVSGGQASFGTLVQGSGNTTSASAGRSK